MTHQAYITATGSFLPNDPISNDRMESVLGLVNDERSRYRERVLSMNGIIQRHYAIDEQGQQNYLNQDLLANAMFQAIQSSGQPMSEVGMLAAGTSMPDVFVPGFASMVHGRLAELDGAVPPLEILTTQGVCTAGTQALHGAINTVRLGDHRVAIAGASELASTLMRGERFEADVIARHPQSEENGAFKYFSSEFLRWMLSDGAGAAVVSAQPHASELSYRVDWIESLSFAHELPTCMFMGTEDNLHLQPGNTWLARTSVAAAETDGLMVLRQDTSLLREHLIDRAISMGDRLVKRGRILRDEPYDWIFPHLSSMVFKPLLVELFDQVGIRTKEHERWFTNLSTVGNIGAAAIYVIMDEALRSGILSPGERILALVPESGRFAYAVLQLTVVAPDGS